jgi:hypothetical protein
MCRLVLRDCEYADTISLYLPTWRAMGLSGTPGGTPGGGLVVGARVRISGTLLCLPASLKKLYLKVDDSGRTGTSAGGFTIGRCALPTRCAF